jgi:hypothetical protein
MDMEVEMDKKCCSDLPVDLEAARLAVEWKELFAAELRLAAQRLATGTGLVTADHYRCALASATSNVLQTINTSSGESVDVRRRIA